MLNIKNNHGKFDEQPQIVRMKVEMLNLLIYLHSVNKFINMKVSFFR